MHWFPAHCMDQNTRHKSLKQEPFVLNFLQISYIHSSHLYSHSNVPLSFPNVEPIVFWSTKMTANPNQHWGGENHTSVSRFVTRIVYYQKLISKYGQNEYSQALNASYTFQPLIITKSKSNY